MAEGTKLIAQNKKAFFNYQVDEKYECGLELQGTEVKSVKAGNISFPDAFAEIRDNEVWMKNCHIAEYSFSSVFNHNPDRPKKLLLHAEEMSLVLKTPWEKPWVPVFVIKIPHPTGIVVLVDKLNFEPILRCACKTLTHVEDVA